jgi:hypothetical protein
MATRAPQPKAASSTTARSKGAASAKGKAGPKTADKAESAIGPEPLKPWLRPTELPGIFLNKDGAKVTEDGVLVSIRRAKQVEAEVIVELGEPATTPAGFLKNIALNPTLPLHTRMQAAIAAAPYYDKKKPLGIEGSDGPPIQTEHQGTLIKALNSLPAEERRAALVVLEKLGALG